MKKSEQAQKAFLEEDNDIKSLGHFTKMLREKRHENFSDSYLIVLNEKFKVEFDEASFKYTVHTGDKFGIIDYFPKVNKVLIRKQNKWVKPGLKWIVQKLIK